MLDLNRSTQTNVLKIEHKTTIEEKKTDDNNIRATSIINLLFNFY